MVTVCPGVGMLVPDVTGCDPGGPFRPKVPFGAKSEKRAVATFPDCESPGPLVEIAEFRWTVQTLVVPDFTVI
jgi:hypothetical protein